MSFIISDKRIGQNPIAKIGKKFIYLEKYKANIEDLENKDKFLKGLNELQIKDIEESIKNKHEPVNDKLVTVYYNIIQELKDKKQRLVITTKEKIIPIPNPVKVERVYIAGISGSGKSFFGSNYIKEYLKQNKKNEFILTSAVEQDEILDKLLPNRITPEDLIEEGVDINDVSNSIWLFDDVYSISETSIRKEMINLIDSLAETSRHDKIDLVITSHLISNGLVSRKILNEATKIVLFPKSNTKQIKYYLEKFENFSKDDIKRFLNLNSRWVMIDKSGFKPVVIYEKGCYIL